MSERSTKVKLEDDGVVLIKNVLPDHAMDKLREEYDLHDKRLCNTEIPKNEPIVVFWTHVKGQQKRILPLKDFSAINEVIKNHIVPTLREELGVRAKRLQLLETIIFNKPPTKDNYLHWHQDVAYFPLKPNSQIAVWFPLEIVTKERGAMNYAIGSHKEGARGSTDLHTRAAFDDEDRPLIPDDPEDEGFVVRAFEMTPNDMLIHDGYTWHYSGPNQIEHYTRRGISVRFITDEAVFDPRPGQGAAFTRQIDIKKGEPLIGDAFPVL